MRIVDLRSDTKTLPSPEMRKSISEADLGDADEGEDPTVNRLEAMAAERSSKEAAVLVTSGTQGNMVAILSQCPTGDSVIVGRNTHIGLGEGGGLAALAGVSLFPLENTASGSLDADEVRQSINLDSRDWPRTGLVSLENTQNLLGGLVLTPGDVKEIADVAHEHDLPFHIDGARVFNAAVALGIPVKELARDADTVTFCLSKGLGAPIGSVLCGSSETIEKSRRWVKYLGGSMRQAGIIAAAGVYALENMVDRLTEDHENARRLAKGLAAIPGLVIDPERVQTNILFCHVADDDAAELASRINDKGVQFYDIGSELGWRFVTRYGISADDVDYALDVIDSVVREYRRDLNARKSGAERKTGRL